jgi:hypothetical protein
VAVIKHSQPLLHARVAALPRRLPWSRVVTGDMARAGSGHGRDETRSLKAVAFDELDFPARPAGVQDHPMAARQSHRACVARDRCAVTDPAAATTPADLARPVRQHWHVEVHHHVRDVSFAEDASTSRTGHGPVNLATLRAAIITALRKAGDLYVPEGRRDHTSPTEAMRLHGLV